MASKYEIETNKKLKGKTIKRANVTGHGVDIVFEDGTIFKYSASDGGYSCWRIRHKSEVNQ